MLIAGYFFTNSDSHFHTQIYLGLSLPVAFLLLLQGDVLFHNWVNDRALQSYTLLLAWFGLSTMWTPYEGLPHILKLLFMLWSLAMVVRLLLDNLRCFNFAVSTAVLLLALATLWSIVQHIGQVGSEFYAHRLDQIGVRTLNPILVGLVAAIAMLYCLMLARLATTGWLALGYGLMAPIFFAALVLSFSRTAFIALLATIFWYQFFIRNYRFAATVSLLTLSLMGIMISDVGQDWLVNISRSFTLELRIWGWRQTLQQISEHWIVGHGVRAPFSVSWVGTPYESANPDFFHTHSLILAIWYQTGIIGLLLFLTMLGLIARKFYRLWYSREVRYFSCIFGFILVACLVDRPALIDRPDDSWIWFWLPLMVALSLDKLLIQRPDPPEVTPANQR